MDEFANKGVESKGSDAEIRESIISRIVIEGYDTSLRREDLDNALRKHFASCGVIIHVCIPTHNFSRILSRYAFIYVNGECEEEALRLDGSDMGGRILQIKAYPFDQNYLDDYLAPMKEGADWRRQRTLTVTGCDPTLPLDDIQSKLSEHFSAGSFAYKTRDGLKCRAFVHVTGEDAVEKALQLSGRSVGGMNIVVSRVLPQKPPISCGYSLARTRYLARMNEEHKADPKQENPKKKNKTKE